MTLALRAAFALAVVGLCIWLLKDGKPFGPVFVIAAAIWLRQGVQSGRIRARLRAFFVRGFAKPS